MNVYYQKRLKAPFITERQTKIIPNRCRKLRLEIFKSNREIIVDDEKYFTLSNGFLTINKDFYQSADVPVPSDVNYIKLQKFEPKVLVWCCISSKGVSDLFIRPSRGFAISSETYIRYCLTRLGNFIV